jgi:myosin heavy subunit
MIGDICALPRLDIDTVVNVLRARLERDKMYTRAGPVLIALNPYKHVRRPPAF